jgi:hypothetical protein
VSISHFSLSLTHIPCLSCAHTMCIFGSERLLEQRWVITPSNHATSHHQMTPLHISPSHQPITLSYTQSIFASERLLEQSSQLILGCIIH